MGNGREVRIAAVADIHFDGKTKGELRELFSDIAREAQVLVLAGDLTTHGEPEQMKSFVAELDAVDLPIVAVLGNHDFDAGEEDEICRILTERKVHVLDGTSVVIEGIGFAGVKGFGGGFGRRTLGPFGEKLYKEFVQAALDEALKLETALRELQTETKVAVLHYTPIAETLEGEPEQIFPFMGSSRLLPPIDTYNAAVVFHGHAHIGSPEGTTPGGVPVYNVARQVLEKSIGQGFRIWTAPGQERRE